MRIELNVSYLIEVEVGVGVSGEVEDRVVQHRMVVLRRERRSVEAAHDLFDVMKIKREDKKESE